VGPVIAVILVSRCCEILNTWLMAWVVWEQQTDGVFCSALFAAYRKLSIYETAMTLVVISPFYASACSVVLLNPFITFMKSVLQVLFM
jgi:hypothetical protein